MAAIGSQIVWKVWQVDFSNARILSELLEFGAACWSLAKLYVIIGRNDSRLLERLPLTRTIS